MLSDVNENCTISVSVRMIRSEICEVLITMLRNSVRRGMTWPADAQWDDFMSRVGIAHYIMQM